MSDPISDSQGRRRGEPDFDPRDIVTPHAFKVDPDLLNTPLAAPWRRLAALLLDLAIAGFIANVAGALVGIPVAYVFYRLATRRELDALWKRWLRGVLVGIGALILFGLSISLVQEAKEWGPSSPGLTAVLPSVQPAPTATEEETDGPPLPPSDSLRLELLQNADDLSDLAAVRDVSPLPDTIPPDRGAALLRSYTQALSARDTAALDSLAPSVQSIVAGRRIETLQRRTATLAARSADLEDEVERLREQVDEPSLVRMLRATANDLGITVGWVGLYFTLFLAWWGGRTPGKYLLGIRVVRLNGAPLTLWASFERMGGYAAGIATGLLGFAQLYWDPNRQAIHDRVAQTVVISTRTGAETPPDRPGPQGSDLRSE